MVRKIEMNSRAAWLKQYARTERARGAVALLWNLLVGWLGVGVLRSPPRRSGEAARQLESGRLLQLREAGVFVPQIIGAGRETLLLTDIGATLSEVLKSRQDAQERDRVVSQTAVALATLHHDGAYLGQAVPRNIIVHGEQVGFIDFEEDPIEVMGLHEAQARDWVLFTAGVSKYYAGHADQLTDVLRPAIASLDLQVRQLVHVTARRLRFLESRWLAFDRLKALRTAVQALRTTFTALAMLLLVDYSTDGDLDIVRFVVEAL